jgi:hypothetical protein
MYGKPGPDPNEHPVTENDIANNAAPTPGARQPKSEILTRLLHSP